MNNANNKHIRVGLAGFGMSGQIFQAPFINCHSGYQLKKVFERTSEKSKLEYPNVEVVRSFEALLSPEIDLVVISTPNQYHFPMAKEAINAGKHVVVEKPVAATSKQACELCELAKSKNVIFSVYQNRRLDGDFLTVKKIIEENMIGEVVDYECHFDRFVKGKSPKQWKAVGGDGINVLYDIGVHLIDQAYSLFGMPDEVYADLRKQREESSGIDNFEVCLYYAGKKAILSAGEVVAMPGPHFMVHGRSGSFIKYGFDVQEGCLLRGMRPGKADWGVDGQADFGTLCIADGNGVSHQKLPTQRGDYGKYYDNLYRAIEYGEQLLVTPEQAADVLRIIEAAQDSNNEKRRITMQAQRKAKQ